MNRVILVDDEQNVLNALRRELQEIYEVETFASPEEAIRHARETEYDIVIADYLMPIMNGVQFLQAFRALQPDVPRLILSAHTDIQGLLNAINETHLFRFIAKPWDRLELMFIIEQAVKDGHLLKENRHLADYVRKNPSTPESDGTGGRRIYQIALVNGNEAQSRFVQNELESGSAHGADNDALWHEVIDNPSGIPRSIGFQVRVFTFGEEALNQIPFPKYDLVIAAQTLGDMSGVEFLKNWINVQPDSARVLLGRPHDLGVLAQAVNDVQVYGFLDCNLETREMNVHAFRQMIWQVNKLKVSVMEALAARELANENARFAEMVRAVSV